MKKHKKQWVLIILLLMIVLSLIVNSIKLGLINSNAAEYVFGLFENKYNLENVDICILDYDYVTGASWRVDKATNKNLDKEYVVLSTIYNPRLLKINKEFDLDYAARYVAVIDKNTSQINIDNEDVSVLKVKEIVITDFYYQNEGFDDIKFGDLTLGGKFKTVIALFVPKFRLLK